jgi:hypothetical protein
LFCTRKNNVFMVINEDNIKITPGTRSAISQIICITLREYCVFVYFLFIHAISARVTKSKSISTYIFTSRISHIIYLVREIVRGRVFALRATGSILSGARVCCDDGTFSIIWVYTHRSLSSVCMCIAWRRSTPRAASSFAFVTTLLNKWSHFSFRDRLLFQEIHAPCARSSAARPRDFLFCLCSSVRVIQMYASIELNLCDWWIFKKGCIFGQYG